MKINLKIFLAGAAAIGLAFALAAAQDGAKTQTRYYYGPVVYSSADGKTKYARTVSLVKRETLPEDGKIIETALQPASRPGGKPEEFTAELSRMDETAVFTVTELGGSFSGTITFTGGAEWAWTKWRYDIKLSDGGSLKGGGRLSAAGIVTKKTFTKPDGRVTLISETLKPISVKRYEALHEKISEGTEAQ